MQQVITITADGGISGLQHKRGRGVDLRQFGHAKIERVSEILWNESEQLWWIRFTDAAPEGYKNAVVTDNVLRARMYIKCDKLIQMSALSDYPKALGWEDYDEAVKAEVKVLNHLRLGGIF